MQGRVSIAAIQSQDGSYLFYSQPETGALAYLKSQWDKEAGAPLYQPIKIAIEKKVQHANAKSPQIAAVSYKSPNGPEVCQSFSTPHNLHDLTLVTVARLLHFRRRDASGIVPKQWRTLVPWVT